MERAQEHAEELKRTIQGFFETNPYEVIHEFDTRDVANPLPGVDPRKGVHLYRIAIREAIPSRIAILAGDCLKDMRSALDYMAWQLGLAVSEKPPETTAFPIFAKRKLYKQDSSRFHSGC